MKIYTRTGDLGETGLFAGPRVGKDMARIEVVGTIDELNAALGVVRAESLATDLDQVLGQLQNELFEVGAELATPDPVAHGTRSITPEDVQAMEEKIDRFEQELRPLKVFILPGGSRAGAGLHLARAICRRAERRLVTLVRHSQEPISLTLLAYLNRLGDFLFVLARVANVRAGCTEQEWQKRRER